MSLSSLLAENLLSSGIEPSVGRGTHTIMEGSKAKARELYNRLKEDLGGWRSIPLNIAVIGRTGVGKSSFINALRSLGPKAPGAAPVGEQETTMLVQSYDHPQNPLLK